MRYFILIIFLYLFSPSICLSEGLEETISFIHTPQQLVDWLSDEFIYEWGIYDTWQNPQRLIHSKRGDCIDFAILASTVLKRLGIPNDILIIKFERLRVKHAICIWKDEDGFYSFVSSQKLFHTKKATIEEAVEKYYPDWERITFASLINNKKYYAKMIEKKNRKIYRRNLFLCKENI